MRGLSRSLAQKQRRPCTLTLLQLPASENSAENGDMSTGFFFFTLLPPGTTPCHCRLPVPAVPMAERREKATPPLLYQDCVDVEEEGI